MVVNELYALPVGLKEVIKIDNIPLYGSDSLNKKFVKSIENSSNGKIILDEVKMLIDNNVVIPCFAESNILSYFRKRIALNKNMKFLKFIKFVITGSNSLDHPLDYVLALFDKENNKIIVLISNHIDEDKVFGKVPDDYIVMSIVHELVHMFTHSYPNKFLNIFKDELNLYYSNFFTEIFKLKPDKSIDSVVRSIYKFMLFNCEMSDSVNVKNLLKNLINLKTYSNLNDEQFKKVCVDYLNVVKIFVSSNSISKFFDDVKGKYKYILKAVYNSYQVSFNSIPEKGCAYEFIYPSEVIAGLSDVNVSAKVKLAIKYLK